VTTTTPPPLPPVIPDEAPTAVAPAVPATITEPGQVAVSSKGQGGDAHDHPNRAIPAGVALLLLAGLGAIGLRAKRS
jgi:hypothetical protein